MMTFDEVQVDALTAPEDSPGFLGRLVRRAGRYAYAGIGVVVVTAERVSEFRHERIEKGIDRLAERGKTVTEQSVQSAGEMAHATKGLAVVAVQQAAQAARGSVGGVTALARERLGVASAADVDVVTVQLDELERQLDEAAAPGM